MADINLGKVIGGVVKEVVTQVLTKEANKDSTKMQPTDVVKVEPQVTKEVTKAVQDAVTPIVENQTNNEPLWKSRVLRGALVTLVGTAWLVFEDFTDGTTPDMDTVIGYGTLIWGSIWTIYGRLIGKGTPTI